MSPIANLLQQTPLDSITRDAINIPYPEMVMNLALATVLGVVVSLIYRSTHKGLSYSQTFVASLVVVPVIVAMMMLLMSGSIAFAFGLLAVFAVVRFRNVLKDTRDTTFVLWSIMEGLGVGTMRYSTAVMSVIATHPDAPNPATSP